MTDLLVRGAVDAAGRRCDVSVVDGRVSGVHRADVGGQGGPADVRADVVLDAAGLTITPGLVDLQVNGAYGIDLTAEPERLWEVAAALPRTGVTAFVPTIVTSSPDVRRRALAVLAAGPDADPIGAVPLGWHFEGPMIAPSHRGAHPERRIVAPSLDVVDGWSREAGVVYVTLAPELPGALEVVRELTERGVLVAIGHTAATSAQVQEAIAAGARLVTHLGNAMAPLLPREPGPVGVALAGGCADRLAAGVIADGHHLDPLFVAAAWHALGPERFVTVTDTTAALGVDEGSTRLGEQRVFVADGTVRLADGTLAGSAASLPACLRVLLQATGCTLGDALATMTSTPARLLGEHTRGRLEEGARADLTLLDPNLEAVTTIVGGVVCHQG